MSNKRVNPFKLKVHLLECEADEKDKKIADLEAKLAESKAQLFAMNEKSNKIKKESYYLKQQLAEKENTITNLIEDSKTSKELLKKEIEELKAQRHIYLTRSVEDCNKTTDLELELQHKDQDKILFAVEQLEQVRKLVDELLDNCGDKQYKVWEVFDNQINVLRNNKDGIH